jgi:hypothetical protein
MCAAATWRAGNQYWQTPLSLPRICCLRATVHRDAAADRERFAVGFCGGEVTGGHAGAGPAMASQGDGLSRIPELEARLNVNIQGFHAANRIQWK